MACHRSFFFRVKENQQKARQNHKNKISDSENGYDKEDKKEGRKNVEKNKKSDSEFKIIKENKENCQISKARLNSIKKRLENRLEKKKDFELNYDFGSHSSSQSQIVQIPRKKTQNEKQNEDEKNNKQKTNQCMNEEKRKKQQKGKKRFLEEGREQERQKKVKKDQKTIMQEEEERRRVLENIKKIRKETQKKEQKRLENIKREQERMKKEQERIMLEQHNKKQNEKQNEKQNDDETNQWIKEMLKEMIDKTIENHIENRSMMMELLIDIIMKNDHENIIENYASASNTNKEQFEQSELMTTTDLNELLKSPNLIKELLRTLPISTINMNEDLGAETSMDDYFDDIDSDDFDVFNPTSKQASNNIDIGQTEVNNEYQPAPSTSRCLKEKDYQDNENDLNHTKSRKGSTCLKRRKLFNLESSFCQDEANTTNSRPSLQDIELKEELKTLFKIFQNRLDASKTIDLTQINNLIHYQLEDAETWADAFDIELKEKKNIVKEQMICEFSNKHGNLCNEKVQLEEFENHLKKHKNKKTSSHILRNKFSYMNPNMWVKIKVKQREDAIKIGYMIKSHISCGFISKWQELVICMKSPNLTLEAMKIFHIFNVLKNVYQMDVEMEYFGSNDVQLQFPKIYVRDCTLQSQRKYPALGYGLTNKPSNNHQDKIIFQITRNGVETLSKLIEPSFGIQTQSSITSLEHAVNIAVLIKDVSVFKLKSIQIEFIQKLEKIKKNLKTSPNLKELNKFIKSTDDYEKLVLSIAGALMSIATVYSHNEEALKEFRTNLIQLEEKIKADRQISTQKKKQKEIKGADLRRLCKKIKRETEDMSSKIEKSYIANKKRKATMERNRLEKGKKLKKNKNSMQLSVNQFD